MNIILNPIRMHYVGNNSHSLFSVATLGCIQTGTEIRTQVSSFNQTCSAHEKVWINHIQNSK